MTPDKAVLMTKVEEKDAREVRLYLHDDGSIEMNTIDDGESPKETFGHDDYEWWVKIAPENVAKLAFALLNEKYKEQFNATDEFKDFCKEAKVEYLFDSYP